VATSSIEAPISFSNFFKSFSLFSSEI